VYPTGGTGEVTRSLVTGGVLRTLGILPITDRSD